MAQKVDETNHKSLVDAIKLTLNPLHDTRMKNKNKSKTNMSKSSSFWILYKKQICFIV